MGKILAKKNPGQKSRDYQSGCIYHSLLTLGVCPIPEESEDFCRFPYKQVGGLNFRHTQISSPRR